MKTLLVDFGSTYTKVCAVDEEREEILGTAASPTTVATDIKEGMDNAVELLRQEIGDITFANTFACSSAAGGLRMIASGLVPSLTAQAAKTAALGAGAKLLRSFSHEMTIDDVELTDLLKPEIFLLVGGTDGGNSACILHNAKMIARCTTNFPVVIAGNRTAAQECKNILSGRECFITENVMPKFGELNTKPAQDKIREIFLDKIVKAKGFTQVTELVTDIIMPTPSAVMAAATLFASGTEQEKGVGELIALDVGGATTDVYSVGQGLPKTADVVFKGLTEPYVKRTVEGDIGMRYSAKGVYAELGQAHFDKFCSLTEDEIKEMLKSLETVAKQLPEDERWASFDFAIACGAVKIGMTRHSGKISEMYAPTGLIYVQEGKDLRHATHMILTGGPLIHAKNIMDIAKYAMFDKEEPMSLRPINPTVTVDKNYIMASMGLLARHNENLALKLMKKELC